jgi:glycosyltransferase involved in cell wall biosynthesis
MGSKRNPYYAGCLKHPEAAKAMGTDARELILQHYTWDKVTAKVIETYTQIVKQKLLTPI